MENKIATEIWKKKYALPDEKDIYDTFRRIAKELASVEDEEKRKEIEAEFFEILSNFRFIPAGRILHAVGHPDKVAPFNCMVLPAPEDNIESIFEIAKMEARAFSKNYGVGIDLSKLRPAGSTVRNAAKYSDGVVSFMELYSDIVGVISQCLSGDTYVLTKEGLKYIKDLKVGEEIWTAKGWKKVTFVFPKRKNKTYKLRTRLGYEIIASGDHKFLDEHNTLKRLEDFTVGEKVVLLVGEGNKRNNGLWGI